MIKNVKIKIKRYLYIKYCNIMNYDKIINEEIDRFINEEILSERKKKFKPYGEKSGLNQAIGDILNGKKEVDKGKAKYKTLKKHKKEKKSKDEPRDVGKKAKKLKNGRRGEFNFKQDRATNPNLNNQDAEDLNSLIDSDYINTAAVAHELYPDHTPEGAQSQLRKKVKGLANDNGSKYKIKKKEAFKLRRILSKELNK
jgi:hypothetical protein